MFNPPRPEIDDDIRQKAAEKVEADAAVIARG